LLRHAAKRRSPRGRTQDLEPDAPGYLTGPSTGRAFQFRHSSTGQQSPPPAPTNHLSVDRGMSRQPRSEAAQWASDARFHLTDQAIAVSGSLPLTRNAAAGLAVSLEPASGDSWGSCRTSAIHRSYPRPCIAGPISAPCPSALSCKWYQIIVIENGFGRRHRS
jgi:hypothetical protein